MTTIQLEHSVELDVPAREARAQWSQWKREGHASPRSEALFEALGLDRTRATLHSRSVAGDGDAAAGGRAGLDQFGGYLESRTPVVRGGAGSAMRGGAGLGEQDLAGRARREGFVLDEEQ